MNLCICKRRSCTVFNDNFKHCLQTEMTVICFYIPPSHSFIPFGHSSFFTRRWSRLCARLAFYNLGLLPCSAAAIGKTFVEWNETSIWFFWLICEYYTLTDCFSLKSLLERVKGRKLQGELYVSYS